MKKEKEKEKEKETSSNHHIAKAHDHFFRSAMSDKRVAKEFFEAHLDADLRRIVDLECMELQSGTFIDDFRQESIADILFKTKIDGRKAYLYLLVDHQSQADELMPVRVLKYTCNIIDQHIKEVGKKKIPLKIPLIVPMVIYHGNKPWTYSTNINDLIGAPKNLVDTYFLKPFTLIDLSKIDDEILKKKTWAGVMELTLKDIFKRDMLPYLTGIVTLLKQLERTDKVFVENVLIYILDRGEINKEELTYLIKNEFSKDIEDKIMTVAEQLKAEGMKEGIKEDRIIIAKRLLSAQADDAFISKITELSLEQIKTLKETTH